MKSPMLIAAFVLNAGSSRQAYAQQPVPAGALVFDHVTVVDVEQGRLVPDQRVVVEGNRIKATGLWWDAPDVDRTVAADADPQDR